MKVKRLMAELAKMPDDADVVFAGDGMLLGVNNVRTKWFGYGGEIYDNEDVATMTEEEKRILKLEKVVVL